MFYASQGSLKFSFDVFVALGSERMRVLGPLRLVNDVDHWRVQITSRGDGNRLVRATQYAKELSSHLS